MGGGGGVGGGECMMGDEKGEVKERASVNHDNVNTRSLCNMTSLFSIRVHSESQLLEEDQSEYGLGA